MCLPLVDQTQNVELSEIKQLALVYQTISEGYLIVDLNAPSTLSAQVTPRALMKDVRTPARALVASMLYVQQLTTKLFVHVNKVSLEMLF